MTSTYIGPYLVVPPAKQTFHNKVRACKGGCAAPLTGAPLKFCGNCGSPITEERVPETRIAPVSIFALDHKWTDFMSCPDYGQNHPQGRVWLPNFCGHGITISHGAEDRFQPLPLANIDSQAMLEKTRVFYAEFVADLRAKFGCEPNWEFGIFVYSN